MVVLDSREQEVLPALKVPLVSLVSLDQTARQGSLDHRVFRANKDLPE